MSRLVRPRILLGSLSTDTAEDIGDDESSNFIQLNATCSTVYCLHAVGPRPILYTTLISQSESVSNHSGNALNAREADRLETDVFSRRLGTKLSVPPVIKSGFK